MSAAAETTAFLVDWIWRFAFLRNATQTRHETRFAFLRNATQTRHEKLSSSERGSVPEGTETSPSHPSDCEQFMSRSETTAVLVDWICRGDLGIPSFGLRAIHVAKRNDRFFPLKGEALNLNYLIA